MAALCLLRISREVIRPSLLLRDNIRVTGPKLSQCKVEYSVLNDGRLLQSGSTSHLTSSVRNTGFFNRLTGDELWQGVTGVSNAGRKRGRAKKLRGRIVDLNRGQFIGEGKKRMLWPGLNSSVIKGKEKLTVKELPPDPYRESKLMESRNRKKGTRKFKVPLLQRGWTGSRFPGMSVGPPDPQEEYVFEGFDSRVLEFKMVANVTGSLGKKMRFSALVVTGNKNGLAGFGLAKSAVGKAAIRKAKNMAAQRLQYIERYNGHTVYHNFYTKEAQTAVFVDKAAEGYGLKCHRALKSMCEVIGIKDISVKVEGSTNNVQNLTKAFFRGLRNQETHQELADRLNLNVVEFRDEKDNLPTVVAAPPKGETIPLEDKPSEDSLDFENLYYSGRVPFRKPKKEPFFHKFRSYKRKYFRNYKRRNQEDAKRERIVLGFQPSEKEIAFRNLPLK